jgi:hypothetical protein
MVKHRLTVEEAKAMMLEDPARTENLMIVGGVLVAIIAVVILVFVNWVM